jgi:SMC interacting uncharacterized protein involved in chromosome segregation
MKDQSDAIVNEMNQLRSNLTSKKEELQRLTQLESELAAQITTTEQENKGI